MQSVSAGGSPRPSGVIMQSVSARPAVIMQSVSARPTVGDHAIGVRLR
jgi:hypothetical protein